MFIRPGFVVVIVGMTLTSLSTIVVMLRYVELTCLTQTPLLTAFRYYCRWYRMGTVGATDHLMFIALVSHVQSRTPNIH